MFIQNLRLQQFRCFKNKTFNFKKSFIVIEGDNGSGKTTILEAINYACFLKSFRTNQARDLILLGKEHFFLQVDFLQKDNIQSQIQIGLTSEKGRQKRLINLNNKVIKSYKDIISHYRIIYLVEDDLQLVQGAPDNRRYFLNQLLLLFDPDFLSQLKKYKQILEHRNKLLSNENQSFYDGKIDSTFRDELFVWTEQQWNQSFVIRQKRILYLRQLETVVNQLRKKYFSELQFDVLFNYTTKGQAERFNAFWAEYNEKQLFDELKWKRSLFGAHLDDFVIVFQDKKARKFASRGQQKLVLFLIKVALVHKLQENGIYVSFLLDDFLNDFDQDRLKNCLKLLSELPCQVLITSPFESFMDKHFSKKFVDVQVIKL